MVDELTGVIRKHRHEDPTTLARLMNVAFGISLGGRDSRPDKLARAHLRGLEARQQLAEAEGGSLSSDEAARLLQMSKTAVLKRLDAGRLLAWRQERLQAARFPRWQFDQRGRVLAGLEEVLTISSLRMNVLMRGRRSSSSCGRRAGRVTGEPWTCCAAEN